MKTFLLAVFLMLSSHQANANQSLMKELEVFAPYLGTWESSFAVTPGQPKVTDVSRWESALGGAALRTVHSINDGEYGGESIIFWDNKARKLKFYYFTNAGFYTNGWLEVLDDKTFVAYEDVTGSAQGITQVKSTSTLSDSQLVVTTQYFKAGSWGEPQKRIYTRSSKDVVFNKD